MKTMKIFKIFSMAALALTMAACSNDDNETASPAEAGVMHFKATIAAPNSGTTTRTAYEEVTSGEDAGKINVKWVKDDKILLTYSIDENKFYVNATVTAVDETTGAATIEATFTETNGLEDGADVALQYPMNNNFGTDVEQQDGTLEYIQDNLDRRNGRGKLSVSGSDVSLKENVKMESTIFIWKLTLTDGTSPINATKVTIKGKFGDEESTLASTKDAIDGKSTVYLAASGSEAPYTITIEATVGTDTYTFSKDNVNLRDGNYYQSTVTLTKVAPEGHSLEASAVGEIVGTDGLAYALSYKDNLPSGVTAAGMVAYKSGTSGLVIALADEAKAMDWDTANGETGAAAHTPAVSGHAWRLPSLDEWKQMFKANGGSEGSYSGLNEALASAGGDSSKLRVNDGYWSSTKENDANAYNAFLRTDGTINFSMLAMNSNSRFVRACFAF